MQAKSPGSVFLAIGLYVTNDKAGRYKVVKI
jgi:hypothetical protein